MGKRKTVIEIVTEWMEVHARKYDDADYPERTVNKMTPY